MLYEDMDLEELLNEYFYARRNADDFYNDCSYPLTDGAAKVYRKLTSNYLKIMAEIERRTISE